MISGASDTTGGLSSYILEVSWGCPNERYPLNGLFQFDQAKALRNAGLNVVYLALDLRSVRRWRKWGVSHSERDGIPVFESNWPCGPMKPSFKYVVQDHAFSRAMKAIEASYGTPEVVHIHCCQQAISATEYCAEKNIPYVITEHITPLDEGPEIEKRKKAALLGAKQVISVSNALGRDLKRVYDVDSVTIPNVVDLSAFENVVGARIDKQAKTANRTSSMDCPGSTDTEKKRCIRMLSAAGMNHGKGFDILIRAYAKLLETNPDCTLMIMGDGPEMSAIRKLASEFGIRETPNDKAPISGISFSGTFVRSEFADELSQSDFFVLPSRSETFGLVYAEALAAGVPVIATTCGGPEDFIDDSNGILVPVDDVDALADAMRRMIYSLDDYNPVSISTACRRRFSPETIAEAIEQTLF